VTTPATRSDVVIVGGGPAGSWAACRLARRGARVVLFDHSHPREKPCGGGVTGRALTLVSPDVDVSALPSVGIEAAEFDDAKTTPATVSLADEKHGAEPTLVVVDRRSFDCALLAAACGAGAVHRPERVTGVEANSSGVRVRIGSGRTFEADWLIGADGANSLVRRCLARPFTRGQLSIAAGYFAHGVTSREIKIRFVSDPPGYIWSFPRRDHLAIGICAQGDATTAAPLKAAVDRWMAGSGFANGASLTPYGWPIPSLNDADLVSERPVGPRWLLAGDAAGLVDPITREGIFFALLSGQYAAEAITDARSTEAYARQLRAHLYPELRRAARLKRGFFHAGFTPLLVDALRRSAPVRRVMADLVAGRQEYRTLKGRLVRTFEVGLAWELLMLEWGRARGAGLRSA
jgi:geranylgeranyl reductase family protein